MSQSIKGMIAHLDEQRRGSRPDVARELSLAITHLEDASYRIALADIREKLHPGDAQQAVAKHEPEIVGVEPDVEVEATTKEK